MGGTLYAPRPPPLKRCWCQLPKPLETHAVQRRHTEWGAACRLLRQSCMSSGSLYNPQETQRLSSGSLWNPRERVGLSSDSLWTPIQTPLQLVESSGNARFEHRQLVECLGNINFELRQLVPPHSVCRPNPFTMRGGLPLHCPPIKGVPQRGPRCPGH